MEQYSKIKGRHPGEILLFRLGDFYEMFYDDAHTASRILNIVLTSRQKGEGRIPMAGIPYHSAGSYINRLLKAGHRVAVCEQMGDPEETEGLVDRAVVRVITPGTLLDEGMLDDKSHNFLCALRAEGERAGLAWIDISTGKFFVSESSLSSIVDDVARLAPSECIVPASTVDGADETVERVRGAIGNCVLTPFSDWAFDEENGRRALLDHFRTANLKGFGCDDLDISLSAAGAILAYLKETHRASLDHVNKLEVFRRKGVVFLDRQTLSSLEIVQTLNGRDRKGSLAWTLDKTTTSMGARKLTDWLLSPLRNVEEIQQRQTGIKELAENIFLRQEIQKTLKGISDIERITAKIGSGRVMPRDLAALRMSLLSASAVKKLLEGARSPFVAEIRGAIGDHEELRSFLQRALVDDPPHLLTEGGIVREGYHEELDGIRSISVTGKGWLASYQKEEVERTGIQSLKVGFNAVFGYYIEVTNVHKEKIPPNYVRKQTLKNAERFITPELKDYENQVLNADERRKKLEYELFVDIRKKVSAHIAGLQATAHSIALVDLLSSLAQCAVEYDYVMPEVDDSREIEIVDGRHPVLERVMKDPFIPNDAKLDDKGNTIIVITGPNMAGKSTYIRQVALITLMAQMGSFVPAKSARIGVVDRIFTRVGASDELTRGASTFMVEMNETANILNNATGQSLIILDEIGRGTSTFDGVSIAWAVVEYLHNRVRARTLFATHYHELTELGLVLDGVKNYHVSVKEWKESVVFLRKIIEGGTDKSYGIHVARIAGIPREVVERAKVILAGLEALTLDAQDMPVLAQGMIQGGKRPAKGDVAQMALFAPPKLERADHPIVGEIREINADALTPLQALTKLHELIEKVKGESPGNKRRKV